MIFIENRPFILPKIRYLIIRGLMDAEWLAAANATVDSWFVLKTDGFYAKNDECYTKNDD